MAGNRHVIIVGPQGAGKGTQAAVVAPKLGLVHLSTGDLFREVMASDTELGREIRGYYDRGTLVPDQLTIRMLTQHLDQIETHRPDVRGVLLDGFPRNQAQAEALDQALEERGDTLAAVIQIAVPRAALMDRLTGRLICRVCGATYHRLYNPPNQAGVCDVCGGELYQRSDDTPEAVERRLNIYYEQTEPILTHYASTGLLVDVNGDRPIPEVTESILEALGTKLGAA
ncbi:MAG TPA: adenylate kinase [Thermomicrobiaceae bacterium]|nr:adenylate kinase [Thermomicrobiaceae bacterium]